MPLYDYLAPAYDLAFEKIYRPFRQRALAQFSAPESSTVRDLACGTGQNFPNIAPRIGLRGHIIGLDVSSGMLRRARKRIEALPTAPRCTLIHANATQLTPTLLEAHTGLTQVDAITCSYGFTSMADPEAAFWAAWKILRPGGSFLILDILAAKRTFHARAVELATRSCFTDAAWQPLRCASPDFRMDYLDPSAHLFGGRLFVASGTKSPPLCA